jgi:hypothetical protein
VDVQPERVVAPDDIAEQLVVTPVMGRVDDPLLLPGRPRVGPGRSQDEPHRVGQRLQLRPALRHRGGHVGERLAASRLDLDLGRDQLADEMRLERRPLRGGLHLLEAVDEVQRDRVEERELLLDRDGEVGPVVEALPRREEQLLVAEPLLVTHAREGS